MVEKYFFIAIAISTVGLIGILKRQSFIMLFTSSETLLSTVNLTLIVASKMHQDLNGRAFVLFVMGVAACEVTVDVAFCVLWYRRKGTLELESLKEEV